VNEKDPNEVIFHSDEHNSIFKVSLSDTEKEVQALSVQITLNERFNLRLIRDANDFNNAVKTTEESLDFKFKTSAEWMSIYSMDTQISAYDKGLS
jgi:hypothetical protein